MKIMELEALQKCERKKKEEKDGWRTYTILENNTFQPLVV